MPDLFNALFVFTLSVVLLIVGIRQIKTYFHIRENGIRAKGFVYDKNGTNLIVRFITKDEEWVTAEHHSSGIYEKGDTVTILYNPANPDEFFIQNVWTKITPYALVIAAAMAFIFGILALLHIVPWHT